MVLAKETSYLYSLKKIVWFIIFNIYFAFALPQLKAQDNNFYFRHYTNENGLSQNSSRCIAQDSTGFIWIGTEDGLNRFDGYGFTHFQENNEFSNKLNSDYITDLYVDKNNILWIGTWNGLNYYDPETEEFHSFPHNLKDSTSLVSSLVNRIFIDSKNYIWIGTDKGISKSTKALYEYGDIKKLSFENLCNKANKLCIVDNQIMSISEDKHHNLWIASQKGLNRYDKKTGLFSKHLLPQSPLMNKISTTEFDTDGNFWVGTNGGLFRFDTIDNKFISYTDEVFFKENRGANQIEELLADNNGGMYIATRSSGIVYFKTRENKYELFKNEQDNLHSLQNMRINDLLIDKSKNLMVVGELGLDIAKINNKPFGLNKCARTENNNILATSVTSVYCPDKRYLWLVFAQQGIARFDRKTKKFKNYLFDEIRKGGSVGVKTIYPASKRELLLGTDSNGLLLFDTQTGQIKQYKHQSTDSNSISSNYVFHIAKSEEGFYWIGTQGGGLNKFDKKTGTFKQYLHDENKDGSIGHDIVTHILIDSKKNVWIATFGGGLNLYNKNTDSFTHYKHIAGDNTSISSNSLTHIFEDGNGTLWIGTASGLNNFDPDKGTFYNYDSEDGLTNEFVYAIQEDEKQNLWISTNHGIFKFDKTSEKFTNYDIESGLQNNEFNINSTCKLPDSSLFFGGVSGFNLFKPDSIKNSLFEPVIAITSFNLFYEKVTIGKKYNKVVVLTKSINNLDTIYLNHKNNQFSFEFTAFDYTKPPAIKYSVRLQGFNELWHKVPATKRYVSYTNLNPGTYTLQIRASNADGVWSPKIKTLVIIIETPFWRTWWFALLSLSGFILILFFIFHMRTVYLLNQKKQLEKQVSERTKTINKKNTLLINQKEKLKFQAEELRSITDQLKDLNNELEVKIESRTTDLNLALEKAEDAQKLISSFLANMSHELRTPMNAISGFSQLIATTEVSYKDKQKYAEIIITNIDMLLLLVENVMDVAKLHTGQYTFVNNTFYLNDLCRDIFDELDTDVLKKKTVDFIYIEDELPKLKIHSDTKAFRHIIFNILENALKYTEKGKVEFSCSCTANYDENTIFEPDKNSKGPYLEIIVSDTGLGIKKEYQKTIFDMFHKVEPDKNKLFRGTGLGLALVKNITNKLFGEIKLESELNRGTIISISIPLSRKE